MVPERLLGAEQAEARTASAGFMCCACMNQRGS